MARLLPGAALAVHLVPASPRVAYVAGQLRRVFAVQTSAPAPTLASLSIPWRGIVNLLPPTTNPTHPGFQT